MGCGCNRNSSQDNRVFSTAKPTIKTAIPKSVRPNSIKTNTITVSQTTRSNPDIRKQICRGCQFSTKNSQNGFDDTSRCRKSNKLVSYIMRDSTFLCPIQKF